MNQTNHLFLPDEPVSGNIPRLGEQRFSLLDLVPDEVSIVREDRTIVFMNRSMRRKYGDLTGRKCFETALSSSEVCSGCPLRSDAAVASYPHRRTAHTSTGRVLDITTSRLEDAESGDSYLVTVIHDETERRNGEMRVDRLAASLDNLSEAIALFDVDGKVVYANRSFAGIMGIDRGEVMGKSLGSLSEGSSFDLPVQKILSSRNNSGWSGEATATSSSGSSSYVQIDAKPVHDRLGKVIGIVANLRDITQERRDKVEKERYQSQLEKRMEERTNELAHRVSQLTTINKISRVVSLIMDPEDLMREVAKSISTGFGYPMVAILIWDAEKGELRFRAGSGEGAAGFSPDYRQRMKEGIIGHAAYFSETLVTGDVDADPRYIKGNVDHTKSEVAIPLTYRGELLGVLDIQSEERNAFTRSDVSVLEMLSDILSTALVNARTYSGLKDRENALSVLDRISKQISMRLESRVILDQVAKDAASMLNAEKALVGLTNRDQNRMDWVALYNIEPETMEKLRLRIDIGVTGRVLSHGRAEVVNEYHADPDAVPRDANLIGIRSMVSTPLVSQGRPIGVINVYNRLDGGGFKRTDAALLSSLADHAAIALENANLLDDLNRRIHSQLALLDTAVSLQRSIDSSGIYQSVAEKLGEVVWYDSISVYRVDHDRSLMVPVLAQGRNATEILSDIFPVGEGVSGHVAMTGAAEIVNDTMTDERAVLVAGTEDDLEHEALMAVPLNGRDRIVGVLTLYREAGGKFSPAEKDIAQLFANQAAAAVENFELYSAREQLFEESQHKVLQMAKVLEVTTSVMYMDDLEAVLQRVSDAVTESFGFRRATISLLDPSSGNMRLLALTGCPEWVQKGALLEEDVALDALKPEFRVGRIAHYLPYEKQQFDVGKFYFVANPELAGHARESPDAWHERDLLVFPMKDQSDQLIGHMVVDEPNDRKVPRKDDLEVLGILAGMASIAVVNRRLFDDQVRAVNEIALLNDLMTHDINNFNQGIMGYLELLLQDSRLNENQRKYAERALVQVKNNAGLIDNIRTLAKVRTMDDRDFTVEDLGLAVSEAIRVVERIYPSKDLAIRSTIAPKRHFVKANMFLRELFANVLSNAVKFDQSKQVKVDVTVDDHMVDDGEYLIVSVVDRGRGIPDDRKTTVFERFATGVTGVKGFGLGLSIVSTMVDRFGGKIWIEDRIKGDFSKGAVFRIMLPKAEPSD